MADIILIMLARITRWVSDYSRGKAGIVSSPKR